MTCLPEMHAGNHSEERRGVCLVLTESFPYRGGDDYLVHEVDHWAASGLRIVIAPTAVKGAPYPLPTGVMVDLSLARLASTCWKPLFVVQAVGSIILWRDLWRLLRLGRLSLASIRSCVRSVGRTLRSRRGIGVILRSRKDVSLAYSYWNDTESFAAALWKREGQIERIVTRAHGFDLYAERRPGGFLPLKEQLVDAFDQIFAVSEHGKRYLLDRYGLSPDKVHVSRLGIVLPDFECRPSASDCLSVVSVAYCVELKRIDKLIAALALVAARNPEIKYTWHHLGDGPLMTALRLQAGEAFRDCPNLDFRFEGRLGNVAVFEFFRTHCVDVIVNTSESEGLPVSLMEAMGSAVPAIAPDVGGISEIIGDGRGYLMGSQPDPTEVAFALEAAMWIAKDPGIRAGARAYVAANHNARINYPVFVGSCLQRVGADVVPGAE